MASNMAIAILPRKIQTKFQFGKSFICRYVYCSGSFALGKLNAAPRARDKKNTRFSILYSIHIHNMHGLRNCFQPNKISTKIQSYIDSNLYLSYYVVYVGILNKYHSAYNTQCWAIVNASQVHARGATIKAIRSNASYY